MKYVQYHVDNQLATVTLNRADAMNSLNEEMADNLFTVMTELKNNPKIKVILLNAAGANFMGGGDVKFFYEHRDSIHEDVFRIIDKVHAVIESIRNTDKIFVVCARGAIAGFGLSLLLAADLVVLSDNAKLTTAYSKIGTTPDGGLTYILPRLIGNKKAMELLMFADIFNAEEAKKLGLINWVVNDAELATFTEKLLARILMGPSLVYAKLKKLLNQTNHNDLTMQLAAERELFAQSTKTKDFHAGISAFVQKQSVQFTGE